MLLWLASVNITSDKCDPKQSDTRICSNLSRLSPRPGLVITYNTPRIPQHSQHHTQIYTFLWMVDWLMMSDWKKCIDRDRTRTCNPRLRKPMPSSLGHTAADVREFRISASYQNSLQSELQNMFFLLFLYRTRYVQLKVVSEIQNLPVCIFN